MQCAVFTHGIAQHQIEGGAGIVSELTVLMNDGRGMRLHVAADGILGFTEESFRIGGLHLVHMVVNRKWLPVEEVSAALDAIQRYLIAAEDEAGVAIPRVGHTSHVSP